MVVIANNCASKEQLTVISKVVNAMHKIDLLLVIAQNVWLSCHSPAQYMALVGLSFCLEIVELQITWTDKQHFTCQWLIAWKPLKPHTCTKRGCPRIRPATWLHFVYEIAFPISHHPSTADEAWYWPNCVLRSWWLYIISRPVFFSFFFFFRFVDCSCITILVVLKS